MRKRWSCAAVTSERCTKQFETHVLVVLNLLQGLDLPQGLVGNSVLQLP